MDLSTITTPIFQFEGDTMVQQAGGFCTTKLKKAFKMEYLGYLGDSIKGVYLDHYMAQDNPAVIFVDLQIVSLMSEEHVRAMLWHEEAHVRLGHIPDMDEESEGKFFLFPEKEIEADRFAAERVGADVMLAALRNMIKVKCAVMSKGKFFSSVMSGFLHGVDPVLNLRIRELRKLAA